MNLVEKLKECKEKNQNARVTFAKFGTTSWEKLTTPFIKVSEEEVTVLIMNWVANRNKYKERPIQIRIRDMVDKKIYNIQLTRPFRKTIRISRMSVCASLEKPYDWPEDTAYINLTRNKLDVALYRAYVKDNLSVLNYRVMEFVNKLQRYQRSKRSIRKTLLAYGDKDWTNYARPLEQLSEEEITILILN